MCGKWGDDVILSCRDYFRFTLARAIHYTDVTALHRDRLLEIVVTYPTSYRTLRKYTGYLAARRAVVLMAKKQREHERLEQRLERKRAAVGCLGRAGTSCLERLGRGGASAPSASPGGNFMDRMCDAAAGTFTSAEQERSMGIALELREQDFPKLGASSRRLVVPQPRGSAEDDGADGGNGQIKLAEVLQAVAEMRAHVDTRLDQMAAELRAELVRAASQQE